jgi:hypothetical protein
MEQLKEDIRRFVSLQSQPPEVAIVDDDFDLVGIPDLPAWLELKEVLASNPVVEDTVMERLETLNHNLSDAPPTALLEESLRGVDTAGDDAIRGAVEKYLKSEHLLTGLQNCLTELGFSVQSYSSKPKFPPDKLPFLLLVDYQLYPEHISGATAQSIFEDLMSASKQSSKPPPFVVLMSKGVAETDTWIWMGLAQRAGFFRFNFDFLHKEAFTRNRASLYFILVNFLRYLGVSRAYFEQMQALETEGTNIVSRVMRRLFQITPAEAQIFQYRMRVEGSSLAAVFTHLFADHLVKGINESDHIQASTMRLEHAIDKEGIPVVQIEQCGQLHHLYADLLHQPVVARDGNSPQFGDIFEREGTFYLVLSQECDLAFGEERKVRADRVLALEGTVRPREATSDDGQIISKPFWSLPEGETAWLWWHLGKPVVIPYAYFAGAIPPAEEPFLQPAPQYRKRLKLRFADAEQIQHAFASHVTRVATDVQPHPVVRHRATLSDEEGTSTAQVHLYVLRHDEDQFIAIEPDSRPQCLNLGNSPFMSAGLVLSLSGFQSLATFKKLLLAEQIFAGVVDDRLILIKYSAKRPRGVSEWKGLSAL